MHQRDADLRDTNLRDGSLTSAEFEAARQRELSRLKVRLSTMTTATHHLPQDLELLAGDSVEQEQRDRDVVRRWAARRQPGEQSGKPA